MELSQLESYIEEHPRSPLFARLAMEYLSAGKTAEAIELCRKGLLLYPAYATGHLVLAKCYAQEASFALALSSLEETKKYISHFPFYDTLFYDWTSHLNSSPQETIAPEPEVQVAESEVSASVEPETPVPAVVERSEQPELSREELEQIQRPLGSDSDEWRIVSRTLAEIFATQGEYDEAIITYRLLMREQPDRSSTFQTRIEELIKLREIKLLEETGQKSPDEAGL
jgi:tetratricopeptide (TPR) repeat protein